MELLAHYGSPDPRRESAQWGASALMWVNDADFDSDQMSSGYIEAGTKVDAMTAAQPLAESCAGPAADECKHGRHNGCEDCKVRLFSVCGALDSSELDALDRISQVRHFPARTMLFDQGALAGSVFNVTEGMVRL
jgi:hypothetical protein